MQSKKDDRDPVDDVGLESWNIGEVFDYIAEDKERCVLVINGYVVDATTYLATHVRYALDFFGVLVIWKKNSPADLTSCKSTKCHRGTP